MGKNFGTKGPVTIPAHFKVGAPHISDYNQARSEDNFLCRNG